uniref:Superkiller viralicidic activity 2-like 2 n=1 Tax=Ascaris lumbricoides TaxID=6252 RepID=A0A9J2P7F8_ASCLU
MFVDKKPGVREGVRVTQVIIDIELVELVLVKMDEDLFGAFEDDVREGAAEVGANPSNEDIMRKIERKRQEECRNNADVFLARMAAGESEVVNLKRPADSADDDVIVKKKLEEDDDGIGSGIRAHPRNSIHTLVTEGNCSHEVIVPVNMEFVPLKPRTTEAAKLYPFQLDAFQKEAITCIDNLQSVLVSAHTSAGKTVVALYAIAMALGDKQRVIYTSPIKALSNQKYRELGEEFSDVGLMTGDVTLNPDASCLVMTTEILRSMLYKGSEIMREVGWVIFDEIHYMRDKERGVVWEETIILLPDNVHYVFLSATIPNARQFADWVVFLHKQPVHVVCTDYRPTPLQHFVYPAGGAGLYEVVNVQGKFREDKFKEAMSVLRSVGDEGRGGIRRGKRGGTSGASEVMKIIRTIKERDMVPCIIFSFSRKECEAYATQLKDVDFNDDKAKKMIKEIYTNAISLLSDEDRKLPQIGQVLPYLLRGIGIHHSGLLPIVKELIEILFGEGLITTLFATETFAMGLNMPARTVLFTSARKFDGKDYRWITSGEYIQMSGRAGRRGKDERGLVILMVDQQMGQDVAKQIIKGAADPLNSQFRLTYNMVLNLLRVEGINPEFMLENSFYQFQNYDALPRLYENVQKKEDELKQFVVNKELEIAGYYQLQKQIAAIKESIRQTVMKPSFVVPFLQAGRLVHVVAGTKDFGWAPILNFHKKPDPMDPMGGSLLYILDVAMLLSSESAKDLSSVAHLQPPGAGDAGVIEVVPMMLDCVMEMSAVRIKLPQDIRSRDAKQSVGKTVKEVLRRFNSNLPSLDPLNDMKIKDSTLEANIAKLEALEKRNSSHPIRKDANFKQLYGKYEEKLELEAELKVAKAELKKAQSLLQLDELKCRKRVLRRLQYCDESDVITHKGRVACEISAADELLLTEMLFGGQFTTLLPEQMAALLSCFVFEEKANATKVAESLSGVLRSMQDYARRIARITKESKLDIDEDKYVGSFKPHMMDVVHEWCSGAAFSDILKKTDIFEGSIIRCLRRLEELLREMKNAAKAMGNMSTEEKFEQARTKLKRDIVFTASLYL